MTLKHHLTGGAFLFVKLDIVMKTLILSVILLTGCSTIEYNKALLVSLKQTSDSIRITSDQIAVTFSNLNEQILILRKIEKDLNIR